MVPEQSRRVADRKGHLPRRHFVDHIVLPRARSRIGDAPGYAYRTLCIESPVIKGDHERKAWHGNVVADRAREKAILDAVVRQTTE